MNISECVLGFLGCGKISSAMVKGFCGAKSDCSPIKIIISPRSADKAEALKNEFPDKVHIAACNEDVVANSDVVFIGLLPGVAREILPTMPFRDNQLVFSMMAAVNYEEVLLLSKRQSYNTVKCVPLPSAANRSGPIIFHPPNDAASQILGIVGTAIPCPTEDDMKPLITLTGHISSFYELMNTSLLWMMDNGTHSDYIY